MGWSKMAGSVKVFAAKPEDLSSIPRTHIVKGENQLPQIVLIYTHTNYTQKYS